MPYKWKHLVWIRTQHGQEHTFSFETEDEKQRFLAVMRQHPDPKAQWARIKIPKNTSTLTEVFEKFPQYDVTICKGCDKAYGPDIEGKYGNDFGCKHGYCLDCYNDDQCSVSDHSDMCSYGGHCCMTSEFWEGTTECYECVEAKDYIDCMLKHIPARNRPSIDKNLPVKEIENLVELALTYDDNLDFWNNRVDIAFKKAEEDTKEKQKFIKWGDFMTNEEKCGICDEENIKGDLYEDNICVKCSKIYKYDGDRDGYQLQ